MAKKLINALRFIVAVVIGCGIAYMWFSVRPDDDPLMVYGVGIVTVILAFLVLYFTGKGGSD